jgi:hypothetical protein
MRTLRPSDQPNCCSACRKRRDAGLPFWIADSQVHEHANAPHPLGLLRARRERPRGHCAAEQRDEIAAESRP